MSEEEKLRKIAYAQKTGEGIYKVIFPDKEDLNRRKSDEDANYFDSNKILDAMNPLNLRPIWQPDEEALKCNKCKSTFSTINRRHHCRHCGLVFCGTCSTWQCIIPKFAYHTPVRVCEKCWNIVTYNLPDIDNMLKEYINDRPKA